MRVIYDALDKRFGDNGEPAVRLLIAMVLVAFGAISNSIGLADASMLRTGPIAARSLSTHTLPRHRANLGLVEDRDRADGRSHGAS